MEYGTVGRSASSAIQTPPSARRRRTDAEVPLLRCGSRRHCCTAACRACWCTRKSARALCRQLACWAGACSRAGGSRRSRAMPRAEVLLLTLLPAFAVGAPRVVDKYFLGAQGASCADTCKKQSLHCDWRVETHDSEAIFTELGVHCANVSSQDGKWWAPCLLYTSDAADE